MEGLLKWLRTTFSAEAPIEAWIPGAAIAAAGLLILLLLVSALAAWRRYGVLQDRIARLAEDRTLADARLGERLQAQESALAQAIEHRLAATSDRISQTLDRSRAINEASLRGLAERLGHIDAAQGRLAELSGQISGLQAALGDKQARGAYGEVQLYDIIRDALPANAFKEQATLSNGRRPDCLIDLPNPPGPIAIDSKFPLEAFLAVQAAQTTAEEVMARKAFARDVLKHINDIAGRYIIPGETADCAMLFVPSEAVYGALHAEFRAVIEASFARRVYIVSPTTLWATLNTARAILKDALFHEQASMLRQEIDGLLADVGRLTTRVDALGRHFQQAEEDLRQIDISTRAIERRGSRITDLQLDEDAPKTPLAP